MEKFERERDVYPPSSVFSDSFEGYGGESTSAGNARFYWEGFFFGGGFLTKNNFDHSNLF